MSFTNCNASIGGGGFYSRLTNEAQMTLTGKSKYYNCHCERWYGGGG
jgi:hypothetical protein